MPERYDAEEPGHDAGRRHPVRDAREQVHRSLDEAAEPDEDHGSRERNSGVAILVLAVVVVLLLLAIVSGATGAFRP